MTEQSPDCDGDFVPIATGATPTEAHLLAETLVAAGLTARVADSNFVQSNSWMGAATAGVRVMVPASQASEARATVAAFNAGAFQLESGSGAAGEADAEAPSAGGSGLKTFRIYRHSARKPAVVAVKNGFSWPALLVGPLWFLLNGMWLTFLLSVSFTWGAPLAIRSFGSPADPNSAGIQTFVFAVFFAVWVFTGLVANFLLGEELKRKGYELGPSVQARSAGEAISSARATA